MRPTRYPGIMEIAKNHYRLRLKYRDPQTGKRREVKHRFRGTLRDAARRREELIVELERGSERRMTLGAFATSWLANRKLAPSTDLKYEKDLRLHILPTIGDRFVDTLRPSDIRELIAAKLQEGLAGWTVANQLRLLRALSKDARADGLTDVDFCARVPMPKCNTWDEDNPNRLSAAQLDRLLRALRDGDPQWFPVVFTMALTGLRWGEVSALRWSDLDHEAGVIRVRRNNWRGNVGSTKTRKKRTAPLGPELAEVLREHRKGMIAAQHPGLTAGWVFPSRFGELYKGSPLRQVLRRAIDGAKLGVDMSPHGLRRSFNDLARRSADRVAVQAIMGHATDAMTDHYSMVDIGEKLAVQGAVLRLITGANTEEVEHLVDTPDPDAADESEKTSATSE